jgi:GT2 family glycosyltransferase
MEDLTSIIIVARNNLEYVKECLKSIELNTPQAHELILVDNASSDGTGALLSCVENATHITKSEPAPFAECVNNALRDTIGDYICLLGPECLVTPGWLDGLTKAMRGNRAIGAVGPLTNMAFNNPGQEIEISYGSVDGVNEFAASLAAEYLGQVRPAAKLSLFCMLMRQEVPEKVGPLDERLAVLLDDDYSLRLRMAGFATAVVPSVFVHRFFMPPCSPSDLEDEKRIFGEKWQKVRRDLEKRRDELADRESIGDEAEPGEP